MNAPENESQKPENESQKNDQQDAMKQETEVRQSSASRDAEEAFKAATHGTDDAPQGHPTYIGDAKESTGRKADDSWKKKAKDEEV